jgi:hypothetical protein
MKLNTTPVLRKINNMLPAGATINKTDIIPIGRYPGSKKEKYCIEVVYTFNNEKYRTTFTDHVSFYNRK